MILAPAFRPVDQVRVGYGRGQCTEASVASLLGCELADVPDLWAGPDGPADAPPVAHQPTGRLRALMRWLRGRGLLWVEVGFTRRALPLGIDGTLGLSEAVGWPAWMQWDEPHLLLGHSPGGVGHATVGLHGRVHHDPNPSRRGLTNANAVAWLVPAASFPAWDAMIGDSGLIIRLEGP